MDLQLLHIFQTQLKLQCDFALMSAKELETSLNAEEKRSFITIFFHLQNLLNAAANIGKTLWGKANGKYELSRKPLRESVGITDASPLKNTDVRNKFEHIDEYISDWFDSSTSHIFADMNLGNVRGTTSGVNQFKMFRTFDPVTYDVTFLGWTCNIKEVIGEIERILPVLIAELEKYP